MASVTTWTRLEPRPRSSDLSPSLEARVYDPAWLLARQWQAAEFRGQDAASPVSAAYVIAAEPGVDATGQPRALTPLDQQADEISAADTTAQSAESGADLLARLGAAGCPQTLLAALATNYPLPPADPDRATSTGASYLAALRGRVPDATTLRPVLAGAVAANALPPALAGATADPATALAEFAAWLAELDPAITSSSWVPERLEYQLAYDTIGHHLVAPEWGGGALDWFDFDVDPDTTPPMTTQTATQLSGAGLPHALAYPGMPDHRWWAFEDARVNLAQLQVGATDLARMLVVEFADLLSNDWYLHPIAVPLSHHCRVVSLSITDSFGSTYDIAAPTGSSTSTGSAWIMFAHDAVGSDTAASAEPGFFLPGTTVAPIASADAETVLLLRDVPADLAWAHELAVTSDDGQVIDRLAATASAAPAPAPSPTNPALAAYTLETTLAPYQFPLVPSADGSAVFTLLDPPVARSDGGVDYPAPLGRILAELARTGLRQEEITAEGLQVSRQVVAGRGFGGEQVSYTARVRRIGSIGAAPVLRFDVITAGPSDG